MSKKPYIETQIDDNTFIREFNNTDKSDLVWHRDKEDRTIIPIEKTKWLFQKDNELPIEIKEEIFIEKERYHRIIKRSGDLKVKIIKH